MPNLILLFIALLFIPGILWATIDARHSTEEKPTFTFFIANSFLFGAISYIVLGGIYWGLSHFEWFNLKFDIIEIRLDKTQSFFIIKKIIDEILISIPLSIILAGIWFRIKYRQWLTSLFSKGKRREFSAGRVNIWSRTFNRPEEEFDYARIVDINRGFMYQGFVDRFSESEKVREIVLRKVTVTELLLGGEINNKIPLEYTVSYMYLSYPAESVNIEFPTTIQITKEKSND